MNAPSLPTFRLRPPALVRLSDQAAILSTVALLIASGAARTRPELARATGLARSTITATTRRLAAFGLIGSQGLGAPPGRGRPPELLMLNPQAGVVAIADLTPHHVRNSVVRMDQRLLATQRWRFDLAVGPEATVTFVGDQLTAMLEGLGPGRGRLRAIVVSVPGPVDTKRGVAVRPPILPGWDGYPVAERLTERLGCPCLVDNDVNLIALAEARVLPADQCPLLVVKVGTGIGGGLITATGELHRGADGAACDIGHLRAPGVHDVICSCGNVGCIEAVASAEAITANLRAARNDAALTQADAEALARAGDPIVTRLIRDAADTLGETIAALVHMYNPARVVLSGPLTAASDDLLAGVRSVVYQKALPLATRNLTLAHSVIGQLSGTVGAAVLGIEHVLSPTAFAKAMAGGSRSGAPAAPNRQAAGG
ncbi:MAG: ROK family protein [Bifidobacteriaceae bacterium]|jgi:predicted NBD/HSP70 family sugar kinase|nr:ROK family protein [Bifidobacteriaceae bacterium]